MIKKNWICKQCAWRLPHSHNRMCCECENLDKFEFGRDIKCSKCKHVRKAPTSPKCADCISNDKFEARVPCCKKCKKELTVADMLAAMVCLQRQLCIKCHKALNEYIKEWMGDDE